MERFEGFCLLGRRCPVEGVPTRSLFYDPVTERDADRSRSVNLSARLKLRSHPGEPFGGSAILGQIKFWRRAVWCFLLVLVLFASAAAAQDVVQEVEEPEVEGTRLELTVEQPWSDVWVEITPSDPVLSGSVLRYERLDPDDPLPAVDPRVAQGTAILCVGADGAGISCVRRFLYAPTDERGDRVADVLIEQALDDDPATALEPLDLDLDSADEETADPTLVSFDLGPGRAVVGRVVEDGFAVPGATVRVRSPELSSTRIFDLPLGSTEKGNLRRFVTTDEDGQFQIPALGAGTYELEIQAPSGLLHAVGPVEILAVEPAELSPESASAPDSVDDSEQGSVEAPSAETVDPLEAVDRAETLDLGEIVLPTGLSFEVQVVDDLGVPLEGARITASQFDGGVGRRELWSGSDADGRATLSGLEARPDVTLTCSAPGFERDVQVFELLPVQAECVLPALASIVGSVAVADGDEVLRRLRAEIETAESASDLEGATEPSAPSAADESVLVDVMISARSEGAERSATLAAATGEFELAGLEAGPWTITLVGPGFKVFRLERDLEPGQVLDLGLIYLPAAPDVDGLVVDPADGEPVPGATVQVVEPWGGSRTITDGDGGFTISTVGDGPLTLQVATEDRPARRVTWSPEVLEGDAAGRRIELPRGGWIRVLTGGPAGEGAVQGRPCVGCPFAISASDSVRRSMGEVPDLETDGRGEALSVALPAGDYFVSRSRFELSGAEAREIREAETRFVRVRADEVSTVRFVDGEVLRVQLPGFDPAKDVLSLRTAIERRRGVPEGNGIVRFSRPESGLLELFLRRHSVGGDPEHQVYLGPLPTERRQVQVSAGAPVESRLEEAVPARLWGSVVTARLETFEGEPLAGSRVRLRSVVDQRYLAETRSGADGRFEFRDMFPGVYTLWIGDLAYQAVSVERERAVDLGVFQPAPELWGNDASGSAGRAR